MDLNQQPFAGEGVLVYQLQTSCLPETEDVQEGQKKEKAFNFVSFFVFVPIPVILATCELLFAVSFACSVCPLPEIVIYVSAVIGIPSNECTPDGLSKCLTAKRQISPARDLPWPSGRKWVLCSQLLFFRTARRVYRVLFGSHR